MEEQKFWQKPVKTIELPVKDRIAQTFKTHALGDIGNVVDFSKGCDQNVYLITTLDGKQFIYKEARREPVKLSNEVYGCNRAKELNIPAPTVLHYSDSYLIETVIKGQDLKVLINKPLSIYQQLGKFLKQLHTYPVNFFGEREKSEHPTCQELLTPSYTQDLEALLNQDIFNPEDQEKIRSYFIAGKKHLDNCQPCLLHYDISDDNVMSDGEKLTGIIDWSDLGGGYPEEDFCLMYINHSDDGYYQALVESYGKINQDKVEYFTAIRLTWMINGMLAEGKAGDDIDKYLTVFSKILGVEVPNLEKAHLCTGPKPN